MSVLSVIVAAIVVALIAGWLVARRDRPSAPTETLTAPFHCVSITFPDRACDAVKAMQRYRFLSHEAPLLPLPKCTAPNCQCRYAHFPDRREDLRRNPYGLRKSVPPPTVGGDRRLGNDRRKPIPPR